jgi:hypothetical protein
MNVRSGSKAAVVRRRPSIARPSHRACAVSQVLCVRGSAPSQIMCVGNRPLLRVGPFIIARRYTLALRSSARGRPRPNIFSRRSGFLAAPERPGAGLGGSGAGGAFSRPRWPDGLLWPRKWLQLQHRGSDPRRAPSTSGARSRQRLRYFWRPSPSRPCWPHGRFSARHIAPARSTAFAEFHVQRGPNALR